MHVRKVYTREEMEASPPTFSFTWSELQAITTAIEADDEIRKTTIEKMQSFTAYARTKYAFLMKNVVVSAK